MIFKFILSCFFLFLLNLTSAGQSLYQYKVNLNEVTNDELKVQLIVPKITQSEIVFYLPRIVPGTYVNSDFGKFIHAVKAFDKVGKNLSVTPLPDSNSWKIKNADKLYKLEYSVEDTWDTKIKHNVYEMGGTNFEEGKNFVINTFGLFGYFEGMKKNSFEIEFTKPANLFASTPLLPVSTSSTTDIFRCENADHLYDSPIMYCVPDTTTIKVGNSDILVSVYSPKKMVTSKYIAENLKSLLDAAKNYLGGKLPVNRYAFLYYFNSEQPSVQGQGALEHSYSSFYALPEGPEKNFISLLVDISSHEFFHIITPLNICSKEVREFNFNETILSRHLWLYEGSTEYDAHHTQVTQGLITPEVYLQRLSNKIISSKRNFNDTLPFTVMSLACADKYTDQFSNVYQKGALISACLDIYLNKLSGGNYGLNNLKHDLSVRYGATNYFKDEELFDEITRLTFPEIRSFFSTYVEGNTPLPYDMFFGWAGVKYIPKLETSVFSMGGFIANQNDKGVLIITNASRLNEFGKKMGYQLNDEIVSFNGEAVNPANFADLISKYNSTAKEGDNVTAQVRRKKANGETELASLTATAVKVNKIEEHKLELESAATPEQLKVRNAWLNQACKK